MVDVPVLGNIVLQPYTHLNMVSSGSVTFSEYYDEFNDVNIPGKIWFGSGSALTVNSGGKFTYAIGDINFAAADAGIGIVNGTLEVAQDARLNISTGYLAVWSNGSLDLKTGSSLVIDVGGQLILTGSTIVHIKTGSKIIIGKRGKLVLYDNAQLIVDAGGILEFEEGAVGLFGTNASISINPGGRFINTGGSLSARGTNMWRGVIIKSNYYASQEPTTNQGYVELSKGALIEDALIALEVRAGGIVKAIDDLFNSDGKPSCTFRNNRKSIFYGNYIWVSNYQISPNVSSFVNCRFLNEASFYDPTLTEGDLIMVEMFDVYGVHFTSCDFICQFSSVSEQLRGYGIKSTSTTFQVKARCLGNSLPGNSNLCSSADLYPCSFSGLYYGIKADESTLFVNNATFDNNLHGCLLEGEYSYAALPKILLH